MLNTIKYAGNSFAVIGLLLCLTAGLARIFGSFYLIGFEALTLFNVGTTLLIAACLAKIQLIELRKA